MRPDKMTSRLQEAIGDAQSLAIGPGSHRPGTAASVCGDARAETGFGIAALLTSVGSRSWRNLQRCAVEDGLEALATLSAPTGEIAPSAEFVRVFNLADRGAQKAGDSYLSSEQVLLAMLEDDTGGQACSEPAA